MIGKGGRGFIVAAPVTALLALAPAALATDMVVWANYDAAADPISKANLDGSGGSDLDIQGTTVASAFGMAIGASAGKIYWADSTGASALNVDGGAE